MIQKFSTVRFPVKDNGSSVKLWN